MSTSGGKGDLGGGLGGLCFLPGGGGMLSLVHRRVAQRAVGPERVVVGKPWGIRCLPTRMLASFEVDQDLVPTADQPEAIANVVGALGSKQFVLLKGATGTGKTLVMGHTIAKLGKPALILSHNKTLAAQLARELKGFLPNSAVELFISYYDSFQPEAYNPKSGTYIAKIATVNKEIDALRHRATKALVERRDVVIVASVSCIYGLGLPKEYLDSVKTFQVGEHASLRGIIKDVQELMYEKVRSPLDLQQACFYVGQNELSLWPPYMSAPIQIRVVNGIIEGIERIESSAQHGTTKFAFPEAEQDFSGDRIVVYPARHHVTPAERREEATRRIESELEDRVNELIESGDTAAAERLQTRVTEDLTMLSEVGFCAGVENYSRHLALRGEGDPPDTLLSFYNEAFGPEGWLLIVDESHVALPQLRAMYHGDRRRKENLVNHGFRLPSALDNRPLKETEFWDIIKSTLFVSATPSKKEIQLSRNNVAEMVIRPTGVMDPVIQVLKKENQLEELVNEIQERAEKEERSLVMAITKRDAEDLADFLSSRNIRAAYLHSGLKIIQRSEVISRLQMGEIDCIVGVNLLREGIDLPEVSLVCVMDADKMGFLRSKASLLQMVGRAARHVNGTAFLFADRESPAMEDCINETVIRRHKQLMYLKENDLQPSSARGREKSSIFEMERENRADGEVDGMDWEAISKLLEMHREKGKLKRNFKLQEPARSGNSLHADWDEETSDISSGSGEEAMKFAPAHMEMLRGQIRKLPSKCGVYLWKTGEGEDEEILYVGKAKNLKSRVASYLRETAVTARGSRLASMLNRARTVEVVVTPGGERDALLLESDLIKAHRPLYNVLLRDSRYYPYIVITPRTRKELPKLITSVRSDLEDARYFGPFTSPGQLKRIMDLIEASLNLRQLRFQLRYGGDAIEEEYLDSVEMAGRILEGDTAGVAEQLFRQGREQHAKLVLSIPSANSEDEENERAWSRVADNAKAAKEMMGLLNLPSVPRRIEAFDISHFYGEHTVASKVVFLDGEPARHMYRNYKLEDVNDDFTSINRAVTKRLRSKDHLPDLIIIDGGKGQLTAAQAAMRAHGMEPGDVQVCALAKQNEELFVPGKMDSIRANPDSAAMLLLRNIRDESHRHAITRMRFGRQRRFNKEVKDIGTFEASAQS